MPEILCGEKLRVALIWNDHLKQDSESPDVCLWAPLLPPTKEYLHDA